MEGRAASGEARAQGGMQPTLRVNLSHAQGGGWDLKRLRTLKDLFQFANIILSQSSQAILRTNSNDRLREMRNEGVKNSETFADEH